MKKGLVIILSIGAIVVVAVALFLILSEIGNARNAYEKTMEKYNSLPTQSSVA